jgi:hypothetical protein
MPSSREVLLAQVARQELFPIIRAQAIATHALLAASQRKVGPQHASLVNLALHHLYKMIFKHDMPEASCHK